MAIAEPFVLLPPSSTQLLFLIYRLSITLCLTEENSFYCFSIRTKPRPVLPIPPTIMKRFFNLPANLRAFFGACRMLALVGGGLYVLCFAVATITGGKHGSLPLRLEDAALNMANGSLSFKSAASGTEDIQFERLTVALKFNLFSADHELAAALRWTIFPWFILGSVFLWFFSSMLRDLCARIEQGDILSEANLRSVKNIGLTLVFYSLVNCALRIWTSYRLGSYLEQHVTVTGINATLQTGASRIYLLPFGDMLTGLLLLLLAEAFRQGLALKTENDLTV
jgi:hypothetical protein